LKPLHVGVGHEPFVNHGGPINQVGGFGIVISGCETDRRKTGEENEQEHSPAGEQHGKNLH
jgi:hypothetical protein